MNGYDETLEHVDDCSYRMDLRNVFQKQNRGKDRGREESEQHFFNIFGDKGRKMNKEIADETGATEEEVNGIMASFLPTFESVIAEEDPKDEKKLMKMFRKDADHAREHGHGWIRRMMGRIFD